MTDTPETGVELIAAERQRQIDVEGWSPEHDHDHADGSLLSAAIAYAELNAPGGRIYTVNRWPWRDSDWKPSQDPVRNLVKAGALIAAEIDRLRGQARD